jgi:hypothetical protein
MLNDDIVSHGLLAQCLRELVGHGGDFRHELRKTLEELLSLSVEVGEENRPNPGYVEFIAWKGAISDRVSRALDLVDRITGPDQEFAYWLCLSKNIDRFE